MIKVLIMALLLSLIILTAVCARNLVRLENDLEAIRRENKRCGEKRPTTP